MTKQNNILENYNYKPILDHGFVGLIDVMGNDQAIDDAARVSYGNGTRKTSDVRGLIRYLMRHKHTSPFEMVEFKFHCKMPIFVARQWIRHRTANVNEMSGRYSVLPEEFYIPEYENIQPQAIDNKQGRSGELSNQNKKSTNWFINTACETSFDIYKTLLGENKDNPNAAYGPYDGDMFEEDFPGIAREIARTVLPLNTYTEWYWKIDLHNLFHFLKLRMDPHAQYEIREYADAMYELIRNVVPIACEAFEDYKLNAVTFSAQEMELLKEFIYTASKVLDIDSHLQNDVMSKREITEFKEKLGV